MGRRRDLGHALIRPDLMVRRREADIRVDEGHHRRAVEDHLHHIWAALRRIPDSGRACRVLTETMGTTLTHIQTIRRPAGPRGGEGAPMTMA